MLSNQPVFAELFGLVFLEPVELAAFQKIHELGRDLLEAFTSLELGDQVSADGVAIPIVGIAGEYYYVSVCNPDMDKSCLREEQISMISKGWIMHSIKGEIIVCGIGYLKDFEAAVFASNNKFVRLKIPMGWSEITVVGGIDDEDRLIYELRAYPKSAKPIFYGNFGDSFSIISE